MNKQDGLGPIDADRLYPLAVFEEVSGLGKAAIRSARGAGLIVRYVNGRGWVYGRDWIDHVLNHGRPNRED